MSDAEFVVQKIEWFQFRTPKGDPFLVMVASLPNGFYTAVPCQVPMTMAPHNHMALGSSIDDALNQLQQALAGKGLEEIFRHE